VLQTRRNLFSSVRQRVLDVESLWLHVNRTAMATRFEVTLPLSAERGVAAASTALDEIDLLEAQLTAFRETSELSFINRHAGTRAVSVERNFFNLLLLCKELSVETDGAFDITAGPLLKCWGFLKREGRLPVTAEIEASRSRVGSGNLLLDQRAQTIEFLRNGVEINLGSIGKGYALDRVASQLRNDVETAFLNAGASSMLAIGNGNRDQGWQIGLRDPRVKKRRVGVFWLSDAALSTSGSQEQFFEHQGSRFGHIIDPRTGWPASGVASVSVIADTAALSDALATAFFVGGTELAKKYCASHDRIMAIMFEPEAIAPIVFGSHPNCKDLRFLLKG